jgi:hypothetical protein
MYLLRVLGQAGAEARDVDRAGTPTHRRLRDRLVAIALATVGFDKVRPPGVLIRAPSEANPA